MLYNGQIFLLSYTLTINSFIFSAHSYVHSVIHIYLKAKVLVTLFNFLDGIYMLSSSNNHCFICFTHQANELLQRSRQAQNKYDKERMLRESLREYQKISQQVDLVNVCIQYRQGIVSLKHTNIDYWVLKLVCVSLPRPSE